MNVKIQSLQRSTVLLELTVPVILIDIFRLKSILILTSEIPRSDDEKYHQGSEHAQSTVDSRNKEQESNLVNQMYF